MDPRPLTFEHSIVITASPAAVLEAFFNPAALTVWWDTVRSVTTPRPLGIYAIEWRTTPFSDELLGTLGGVFYGTVMEFRPRREFFLADAYWLPPQADPFGPMALEVSCRAEGPAAKSFRGGLGDSFQNVPQKEVLVLEIFLQKFECSFQGEL